MIVLPSRQRGGAPHSSASTSFLLQNLSISALVMLYTRTAAMIVAAPASGKQGLCWLQRRQLERGTARPVQHSTSPVIALEYLFPARLRCSQVTSYIYTLLHLYLQDLASPTYLAADKTLAQFTATDHELPVENDGLGLGSRSVYSSQPSILQLLFVCLSLVESQ